MPPFRHRAEATAEACVAGGCDEAEGEELTPGSGGHTSPLYSFFRSSASSLNRRRCTDARMHGCARLAPRLRWGTDTGGRRFGQGLAQPPATEASAQSATARCLKSGTLNGYNMHAFGATRVSVRCLKTAPENGA